MKLSIITVCYNNLDGLKRTYDSLKNDLEKFEWVIVDGGSKDGTVDYVENTVLVEKADTVFVTEADNGIFDAMNKGVNLASCEFLLFLNSGDLLDYPLNEIFKLIPVFQDINVFGIQKIDKFNKVVRWSGGGNDVSILKRIPIPHQSTIVRKKVFEDVGLYNLRFKILSDHDFFSRAYLKGYQYKFFTHLVIASFYLDGVSSRLEKSLHILRELEQLQWQNFKMRLPFSIKIRYYYKYMLSYFPFSEQLMSISRNLFFSKH